MLGGLHNYSGVTAVESTQFTDHSDSSDQKMNLEGI